MKCCTLPDGAEHEGGHKKGQHRHHGRGSLLAKAAKACKGKHKSAFRKCVSAKIKQLKR